MPSVVHPAPPRPAHRYDAAQDRWFIGPALTSRRFALGGATLDSAIYAVGGYNGDSYLTTLERLDPREGRRALRGSECRGQRGLGLPVGQARRGSWGQRWAASTLFKLGPSPTPCCRWVELEAEMGSKRGGHACVAAGGLLYALGGFNSQQAIPHCEVFDPRVRPRQGHPPFLWVIGLLVVVVGCAAACHTEPAWQGVRHSGTRQSCL